MHVRTKVVKWFVVSLVSAFILLSAGCGGQNAGPANTGNESANANNSAASVAQSSESGGKTEPAAAVWPERTINLVVFSSAGGGADLGNRALAAAMEKELGVKINVINMPGGSGGVAANYVTSKPHDGYHLLGMTEGLFPSAVLGVHPSTSEDWEYFLMGGTPGVISVREDSPFQSIEDVIQAMKERPGEIKMANSVVGAIWDIKATLLQQATGIEYKFIPYQGSNPSILAALSGEVDVVLTGLGEQSEFLAAKKLRPLAIVEEQSHEVPGYGEVPSIVEFIPELKGKLSANQIVGFAVPSDVPKEVLDRLNDAFAKAMQSEEVAEYAKTKYVTLRGLSGQEAKDYVKEMESLFSWLLYEKGVAVRSPEEYGIAKPE
ncbi:tripartite tricarboxylate transporter substrate binding protein [Parageobacillus thermoglucosidasius]|uniref:tripartite tricarboxylate transporter substrate binding protein n=1 Tax=Parageobacillus thermoglucosidasius TaxID=1426 RepID=UPI00241EBCA5|nr:tripartite tricarboxylate transporter substrate binding protein [Parageobacillus thermoglucosidasius]